MKSSPSLVRGADMNEQPETFNRVAIYYEELAWFLSKFFWYIRIHEKATYACLPQGLRDRAEDAAFALRGDESPEFTALIKVAVERRRQMVEDFQRLREARA